VLRFAQCIEGSNEKTLGTNGFLMPHRKKIIWRTPTGEIIACVEKNKVMHENLLEIRQVCQDALGDAVLMGCDEQQVRAALTELINNLENPYPPEAHL
jgi:hypothetical protein